MKSILRVYSTVCLLTLVLGGCHYRTADIAIQVNTLKLTKGNRILIFEAEPAILSLQTAPLRQNLKLPDIDIIGPPPVEQKFLSVEKLVQYLSGKVSVDMILAVEPVTTAQKEYNPYSVIIGFDNQHYQMLDKDGKPIYGTRSIPVYETRYKNRCIRTSYQVSQYDGAGNFRGQAHIDSTPFQQCPPTSDEDVFYDDFEYLMVWLKTNIQAK
ncbi:MAG: hypothetical protein ABIK98_12965 [Pseudomonadota bacterium]|uniref:Lipoprotein n=1 Tax=Candidatus Desulfatibia profunda TaxID=2841695 RepID=A0A8J6NVN1_9BACT|nr:hypothetical protein [Candidatus Desulfatibia profunda]MBL7179186.1 hypothetical protein [Desulfobacterales bacterium]